MGTIALLAWVVALVFVVIGVVVNVALYMKGAFKPGSLRRMRRLEPMTLSRETTEADRDYYLSMGATGHQMDAYSLRMLRMFIFSIILVALFFLVLIVSAIPRS